MTIIWLKYSVMGLCFVLGALLHARLGLSQAWYLYAGAGLLAMTQLLMGNVWSAYSALKRGQLQQASRILKQVWAPGMLLKRNRAYFYFTKGMLALQAKQLDGAATGLEEAINTGLEHPNDGALAALNLAHISYVKQNWGSAAEWLEKARSFAVNDLMIKEKMSELEQALASRQN
ncbi:tetratricopeptide repeat protein [Phaeodactylibacter luteus]|uniref:Tetratricopeptide repeat protein n=1 Tax=Phaeodactylibacter luteus TaxID=1564516 RepID=A0A5C6RKV8_9BACT|nr:hypothetical protein [Phaeodactylibacter luteus]TXB62240.1 hypothetical protein FRY97_14970 [Phaeodactylibacter luteus]